MNLSNFNNGQDLLWLSFCPQLSRIIFPLGTFYLFHTFLFGFHCLSFLRGLSWVFTWFYGAPEFTPWWTCCVWFAAYSVVSGTLLCVRKPSWRDIESERWCMMRNFGSFCLFKILMASPLLPWGRWPFLGHLPTALLLSRLCWNASKPTGYTLFSRSAWTWTAQTNNVPSYNYNSIGFYSFFLNVFFIVAAPFPSPPISTQTYSRHNYFHFRISEMYGFESINILHALYGSCGDV